MSAAHTPTPWHADDAECMPGKGMTDLYGADRSDFGRVPAVDGEHIVRCVNAHDELVAALTDTLRMLEAAAPHSNSSRGVAAVRAVLAKATS